MMTTERTTWSEIAAEFARAFEQDARPNGEPFYKIADSAPEWLQDHGVMRRVHESLDDRMPDDWVYETAEAFTRRLGEYEIEDADDADEIVCEIADSLTDHDYSSLARWLAMNNRNGFLCDEADDECAAGKGATLFDRIHYGQFLAVERIGRAIIAEISAEHERRNA